MDKGDFNAAFSSYGAKVWCDMQCLAQMIRALRGFLSENDMMAYLTAMAIRLLELQRVLKPTGSLYLHCDPTASHYLKIVLDGVFGIQHYRNEIIWKRSNPKSLGSVNFPTCSDTIFRYSKTDKCVFRQPFAEHDPEYVESAYRYSDEKGRYRLLTSALSITFVNVKRRRLRFSSPSKLQPREWSLMRRPQAFTPVLQARRTRVCNY